MNSICSGGCGLRGMQLCICKYVHSIHTHRFKSFATIFGTFIETVILYDNGALINELNLLWWVWIMRYATMHLQTCSYSIHTHCFKSFATIFGTFIETVILYALCALINELNLLWWVWIMRYATMHLQTCSWYPHALFDHISNHI